MGELIANFFVEVVFEIVLLMPGVVIHKLLSREHKTYKEILNSKSSKVFYLIYGYCFIFWLVFIGIIVGIYLLTK